ncbi:hypothetical protein FCN49_004927 [Escherichia coli]|nr:hypothetical protein [Escherichia coli]
MTTLTQCQQQVLDMLISYQKERGFPPTNQEVATMLGYRSVNAAVEHLRALLAGEENARLRAAHWLHERGLKV